MFLKDEDYKEAEYANFMCLFHFWQNAPGSKNLSTYTLKNREEILKCVARKMDLLKGNTDAIKKKTLKKLIKQRKFNKNMESVLLEYARNCNSWTACINTYKCE